MIRISKLIPEQVLRCNIANSSVRALANRATGKTLGQAIKITGEAMTSPLTQKTIKLESHESAEFMVEVINQFIKSSGLQFIEVTRSCSRVFVIYNPFFTADEWKEFKGKSK